MGESPRLRGAILLHQITLMKEDYGNALVDAALERMGPGRREIEDAMPVSWLDVESVRRFKVAAAEELGMDPLVFQRTLVRRAMSDTLRLWRHLLRFVSDAALVKRAPILYSKGFDKGRLDVESIEPGRATMCVRGWPDMPEYDCIGLAAGIEALLELVERKNPRVTFDRLGLAVALEATWDV